MKKTLYELAKVLRSKNSGPFSITLDILFDDPAAYRAVKDSGALTPAVVAQLYKIPESSIETFVYFDLALGLKITFARAVSSGSALDTDVYGAQQHAPLMDVEIDI